MVLGGLGDGGERPVAPVVREAAREDVALDRAGDGMDVALEEAGDLGKGRFVCVRRFSVSPRGVMAVRRFPAFPFWLVRRLLLLI